MGSGRYSTMPAAADALRRTAPRITLTRAGGVERIALADPPTSGRIIEGIAATANRLSDGRAVYPEGCMVRFPIPLLWEHGFGPKSASTPWAPEQHAVGEVFAIIKSREQIRAEAYLFVGDHAAEHCWQEILAGKIDGFSVLATDSQEKRAGSVRYLVSWRLKELSVTSTPANKDARFWIRDRARQSSRRICSLRNAADRAELERRLSLRSAARTGSGAARD